MKQDLLAIYEGGVLHPLEQLTLAEKEQVAITVYSGDEQWLDTEAHENAVRESGGAVPLAEVRRQLAKIRGSLADVVIAERGEY